ncbi:MAG: NAD-dependent DNA ligase LigA [Rhabdochlamydiaceae bacterium]
MSVEKEYESLIETVNHHNRCYYSLNKPEISDYDYDILYKKLENLEKQYPSLIRSYSPTQRVADPLDKGFIQVPHTTPMLSLSNTYSIDELKDFIRRVQKSLNKTHIDFCLELKMDGVAVSVLYEKGIYKRALTRGDGKRGDDITLNLKTIKELPLKLPLDNPPERLELRGEVFMTHQVFSDLNSEKQKKGEDPWANPRNAAAGSLKLLDSQEVKQRKLSIIFYGLADESKVDISSQYELHASLAKWGLPCFDLSLTCLAHDLADIQHFINKVSSLRKDFPFDIDGVVVKVDHRRDYAELGQTHKVPRYAVAYKFSPEQALTQIKDITLQVGRSGVVTPVAELDPVVLCGSRISRATLHNEEEIKQKDIRIGDWVFIEKGGDVIPKVVSVVLSKRSLDSEPWQMPKFCPCCHSLLIKEEVAVRCYNSYCQEQKMKKIAYFVSKDGLDIEHMGEKIVEQLFTAKLIDCVSDIYFLTHGDLLQLDGFREKSAFNLISSIEKSKKVPLNQLILALGIRHVGKVVADLVSKKCSTIQDILKLTREELMTIDGVGDKVADSIIESISDPQFRHQIQRLLEGGVTPYNSSISDSSHIFNQKSFVLTGTLSSMTRSEAENMIKQRGGEISSSVGRKVDYIICGDDPGSKLLKAQKMKIRIITEKEFLDLL